MIKFFRHIRRALIEKNQMGKYFKYATGEILLVVIGILIALQINNWNENQNREAEELEILKALIVGLETDLLDLKYNVNLIEKSINAADEVLRSISHNETYKDTIADLIGMTMYSVKFQYSTSAFETLKSKGVDLISNQNLRDDIISVYDSEYNFFLNTEKDFILDTNKRGLQEIFPSRFEESNVFDMDKPDYEPRLVPLDFESLNQDQEFLYFFKSFRNRLDTFLKFHYKSKIIPKVSNLIENLEKEIQEMENNQ